MNSSYPLVSCITTTYNKYEYLYQTLDSIFAQDYPNIELVLGDDGSRNFPEQEIWDYICTHKGTNITNVVVLHEDENHGTVWNCSNCRDHASGTYIMGIASDDRFYDEHVVLSIARREHHLFRGSRTGAHAACASPVPRVAHHPFLSDSSLLTLTSPRSIRTAP
jgi:glycosyltransferase involved in cell wall biosynthesis